MAFQDLRPCATGLFFAVNLGAADIPSPLASALSRLDACDAYAWTVDTQTPGAPFTLSPIKGWAKAGDIGLLEATVEGKTLQTAILGARRIVKLDTEWETPAEVVPKKGVQAAETARLLRMAFPTDALGALLKEATAIRADGDGAFSAALGADAAMEIIRSPMKDLPKRGPSPEIKDATASIQLWVRNGALQRYVISSTARISLPFGTREIKQAVVVELREIRAADVTLPPAVFSKLQSMTNL